MTGTVLDAAVLTELLIASPLGRKAAAMLPARRPAGLHIPHLAVVETASALRHLVRGADLTPARARDALTDLGDLPVTRWPAEGLLPRMWELRDNVSTYDATYVALAEALDAELMTTDRRLARAAAAHAGCRVVSV